ncbi:MAG: CoA-binding protein [Acidobacteriota bacterium]|nr:CoA-binding protein [Acidobacteriota bacterium]
MKLAEAAEAFLACKKIAVAGVSSEDADQPANLIYRKLRETDHRVFATNPKTDTVEGDPCYPNLSALPEKPEAVVILTHADVTPKVVEECVALNIQYVWMHHGMGPGSVNSEAARICRDKGIHVIAGACPMMFCKPVDPVHRCFRWFGKVTGRHKNIAA